jgi:hypothetical protein
MTTSVLTLAISTLGVGINRVVLPESSERVCFLILWQEPTGDLPRRLIRPDVEVVRLEGRGLSKSRNAALRFARTRFVWLFDDDATPDIEAGLSLVDRAIQEGWSIVTGMVVTPDGVFFKAYPSRERRWTIWNAPKVSSIETILDVEAVRAKGLFFDERFGLGARWIMGEEFVFMASAIRAGLVAMYVPKPIAVHPLESTGKEFGRDGVWQASSASLSCVFGVWSLPIKMAMVWRKRRFLGLRKAWLYLWVRP